MRSCKAVFFISCLSLFLFFCSSAHAVNGVIDDIRFESDGEGSESVVFQLNGTSLPKAFALKGEKPRVVFDFINTQLAKTVPSVITTDGRMVEKIRMGRHSDKTRVVLDLVSAGVVNFDQDFDAAQNILTIHLYSTNYPPKNEPKKEEEKTAEVVSPVVAAEESKEAKAVVEEVAEKTVEAPAIQTAEESVETAVAITPVEPVVEGERISETEDVVDVVPVAADDPLSPEALLSDVKFENTSNKGEMVLFTLNGFYPPEVSGQENGTPKVTCVFAGTGLGADLIKEQSPNGEFISRIVVKQESKTAPINVTLELVPNKNYDLQQVFFKEDNLFVIIVNSYDAMAAPAE